MARHNFVQLIAFVKKEPRFKETVDGPAGLVALTTIMSERDYYRATTGYQLNSVTFCAKSKEEEILNVFRQLSLYNIVEITGFLATKEVEKTGTCPYCGTVNKRTEACVTHGKPKAGGNEVFIYPITMRIRTSEPKTEQEAYEYLHSINEDVNRVFVMGNVTSSPVTGTLNEGRKQYTRFQLGINRKYCPKGGAELYERTDYPWVYSYGDKAIEDFQNIETGALIFIDGALQSRKYKEQYICKECNQEFDVKGRTLEVLSYDTEYLRLPSLPEHRPSKRMQETEVQDESTI